MQRQKSYKGHRRRRYSTAVDDQIEKAIERECKRYDVAKSWVIRNALAFTFNIDITHESYKKGRTK